MSRICIKRYAEFQTFNLFLSIFKLLFFDSFDCFVSKSVRVNDSQLASW